MERRGLLLGFASAAVVSMLPGSAFARQTALQIKDIEMRLCANPKASGVPGSATYKATCYEILGTVVNTSKEAVNNADVYGKVLDATNDPVLRSGRVGSIQNVPVGESRFRLEITVANSQPLPLKFKNFKAEGFNGIVNNSGNPYDMDYEN